MFSHIVCGVVSFCRSLCVPARAVIQAAAAMLMLAVGFVAEYGARACAFAVVTLLAASSSFAQSGPTLPDLGIDPADYIPLASAAVAAIALVAIGYKIGWKVLFRGLGWIGRALSPR
ncbi:MAG: hypothetical protein C0483_03405 [Pirellula sp.]|nr:hypothetical protein [Pirellula sp.]